jgi:hypothetical protein
MTEGKDFLNRVGSFLHRSPLPIPQSPHGIGCRQAVKIIFPSLIKAFSPQSVPLGNERAAIWAPAPRALEKYATANG